MVKVSRKEIVDRVKKRQREVAKENVTFRLRGELLKRFRERCEKESVSMTSIVEELMAEFLRQ
jgi:hypothetical protein